jgi:hypothetical protein
LFVGPLEIVGEDQRWAEGAQRPMRSLEEAKRLQPVRRRGRVIEETSQTSSVAWCACKRA